MEVNSELIETDIFGKTKVAGTILRGFTGFKYNVIKQSLDFYFTLYIYTIRIELAKIAQRYSVYTNYNRMIPN